MLRPVEVFSVASCTAARTARKGTHETMGISAYMAAEHDRAVTAHGNLMLGPHGTIGTAPGLDVVILPGGDTRAVQRHTELPDWLQRVRAGAAVTAAVCTGAFVLAEAGLLRCKRATTHWESIERLAQRFPDVTVERAAVWLDAAAWSHAPISRQGVL